MITLSTMTTGWHYFIDVLGGLVLAVISLALAKRFVRSAWLAEVVQAVYPKRAQTWCAFAKELRPWFDAAVLFQSLLYKPMARHFDHAQADGQNSPDTN